MQEELIEELRVVQRKDVVESDTQIAYTKIYCEIQQVRRYVFLLNDCFYIRAAIAVAV